MTENTPAPETNVRASAAADKAYRKASRPWFKKKRFLLPLILLVIFIIASATGGNKDSASTEKAGTDSAAAPASEAAPAFPGARRDDVVGQAGATLKLGDATVTSTPIAKGDTMYGVDYPSLCTTATLSNGSKDTISFSIIDWKLQTPSGTILNTNGLGSTSLLSTGEIAPGGKATGDVCFDNKSKEVGQFVVLYGPVFTFFTDRAAWINQL